MHVFDTLDALLLAYGGHAVWLFIYANVPQIIRNYRAKVYTSGARTTWVSFLTAYAILGPYMFRIGENVIALGQLTGLVLTAVILIQSLIYRHAKK